MTKRQFWCVTVLGTLLGGAVCYVLAVAAAPGLAWYCAGLLTAVAAMVGGFAVGGLLIRRRMARSSAADAEALAGMMRAATGGAEQHLYRTPPDA